MPDSPDTAHVDDLPLIGVVSDTHSHYESKLDQLFAGVAHIVHAGDFGTFDVVERLRLLAPVTAVCGNVDRPYFFDRLPWDAVVAVAGLRVLVGHIGTSLVGLRDLDAERIGMVVSGHSHRAAIEWRGDRLFLNPGYAGRPRFGLPRSVALVTVRDGTPEPRIVPLD